MSYDNYYQSGAPAQRLFHEHRYKIYYLAFIVLLVVSAVAVELLGFPTIAGMLISYIVLFSVVSVLFILLPIAFISAYF